jgi:glycosyltransferase involved in cell wall biosynthesis
VEETAPEQEVLHVVEPTLSSNEGHCRPFVEAVSRAAAEAGLRVEVWAGRGAAADLPDGATLHRHFHRRRRQLQAFALFRRLLRRPGRILVSTAGTTDFLLLRAAAPKDVAPGKAALFVHWARPSTRKAGALEAVARACPWMRVAGPTATVAVYFRERGFDDVLEVPYPLDPRTFAPALPAISGAPFTHLLFAGAARIDKGFREAVDVVARLALTGSTLPVRLQVSPRHYGKRDAAVEAELERLARTRYAPLEEVRETLEPEKYDALFRGAICVQPYRREDFVDRISGVTLDALRNGSPVVVPEGTWMARVVAATGAGIAVAELSAEGLLAAAEKIRSDDAAFRERAIRAAATLRERHDPRHLVEALRR